MGFGKQDASPKAATHLNTPPQTAATPEPAELIIGSAEWRNIAWCPVARTLSGWSETFAGRVYIQSRCRRWSCPHCGRRRVISLSRKVKAAGPSKFITLTIDPGRYDSPRDAFTHTARKVAPLVTKLRRRYGPIEYLKVLEATRAGWPHYHLCVISDYIPQSVISEEWCKLTGAHIVDIRQVRKVKDVYWYMVKYLAKQTAVPWTKRRVSWTKQFFANCPKPEGLKLELSGIERDKWHPQGVMEWAQRGRTIRRLTADAWLVLPTPKQTLESIPEW